MTSATRSCRQAWAFALSLTLPFLLLFKLRFASLAHRPFLFALVPVVVCGWYGGLLPSVLASMLGALLATYWFEVPFASFRVSEPFPLVVFLVECLVVCTVTEAFNRTRRRSEALLELLAAKNQALQERDTQLRAAHATLEQSARESLSVEARARHRAESALRSTEAQLRHAHKMEAIGVLAGGIAHDFNNLMAVVLSYCTLITEQLTPGDPVCELVSGIDEAGRRAADLTARLLAFGRQQVLQPTAVDLNEVVTRMETVIRELVGSEIPVATALGSRSPCVLCDQGQIEQVLLNLADNARDAMPEGGHLSIETADVDLDPGDVLDHPGATAGPSVMIAVSDTGVGMSDATRARIFEPFFTTKGAGRGPGLGLSTAHGIVTQSGGSLRVTSELGRGTTFRVYLPRITATAAPA